MSDQRELRKIFGPKREKVTGNRRKLHSKKLQEPKRDEVTGEWRKLHNE